MERIVLLASFFVIFSIFSFQANLCGASFVEASDPQADRVKARLYDEKNGLVQRVKCTTDTIDGVVQQYNCQNVWLDVQRKLQNNMNNLFSCLRYSGFAAQG